MLPSHCIEVLVTHVGILAQHRPEQAGKPCVSQLVSPYHPPVWRTMMVEIETHVSLTTWWCLDDICEIDLAM